MSRPVDERLIARVDQQGHIAWSGATFRHTTLRRDPLSGAGARLNGGRWNPKDLFAALYLATPASTCMGELTRTAQSQGVSEIVLLQAPRLLHEIDVTDVKVLDLRDSEQRSAVGITDADISDSDWTICQQVGHSAWFLGLQGIVAPSATGAGSVLTLFEGRIEPGQVTVSSSRSLTFELYSSLI